MFFGTLGRTVRMQAVSLSVRQRLVSWVLLAAQRHNRELFPSRCIIIRFALKVLFLDAAEYPTMGHLNTATVSLARLTSMKVDSFVWLDAIYK